MRAVVKSLRGVEVLLCMSGSQLQAVGEAMQEVCVCVWARARARVCERVQQLLHLSRSQLRAEAETMQEVGELGQEWHSTVGSHTTLAYTGVDSLIHASCVHLQVVFAGGQYVTHV